MKNINKLINHSWSVELEVLLGINQGSVLSPFVVTGEVDMFTELEK